MNASGSARNSIYVQIKWGVNPCLVNAAVFKATQTCLKVSAFAHSTRGLSSLAHLRPTPYTSCFLPWGWHVRDTHGHMGAWHSDMYSLGELG